MAKKKASDTGEDEELDKDPSTKVEGKSNDGGEEDHSQDENLDVDFEAIAVQESERADVEAEARRKAEKALADGRFKNKGKDVEEGDSEEDKPLTEARLREILADERRASTREGQADKIADIAKGIASSEAEARAIIAVHANRSFPNNLPLAEQLEEAKAIVNRKRNSARQSELVRALKGKDGEQHDSSGGQRDGQGGGGNVAPKLPQGTQTVMSQGGFKWDSARKLYSKKLPSGKTLFANPKAGPGEKRQWIE